MFQLDLKSRKPLYEQIVDNYKVLITSNVLKADEKVPSVRELANQLTINPNTIQKAYKELENQGYLYSTKGIGSFVSSFEHDKIDKIKVNNLSMQIQKNVWELLYIGMTKEQLQTVFDDILSSWEGEIINDWS